MLPATRPRRLFLAPALVAALWSVAPPPGPRAAEAAASAANTRTPDADPRLAAILETFDATQAATRTLTARFTERKDLKLLKDPVISHGEFFYTKPDDVLWKYSAPDERLFLITREELLAYFPGAKRAHRVSLALFHDRLLKVLAIGQASSTLKKFYDIRLVDGENDLPGTALLALAPRKKSLRKRLEEVRIWISSEQGIPVRMEYREPDGDLTRVSFHDVRFNPSIASSVYRIEIPEDVEVRRGMSGMPVPRAGGAG